MGPIDREAPSPRAEGAAMSRARSKPSLQAGEDVNESRAGGGYAEVVA